MNDFKERVKQYEKIYVPIGENEEAAGYSFCQMIDVGRKFVMHNIKGYLATQTVHYLQHFNLSPRQIWLTRHGESMGDVEGKFGGNSDLSHYGVQYAKTLSRFIAQQCNLWAQGHLSKENTPIDSPSHPASHTAITGKSFHVWTSNMKRSIQTAQHFNPCTYEIEHLRMLDELNAGILEGLTRDKIKEFYGDWLGQRQEDKLRHRYPGTSGEGYVDLTNRLKSVILEVERLTDHVLIISGLAVTRVLLAYFKGLQRDKITDLRVPLGTLYLIEPVSLRSTFGLTNGLRKLTFRRNRTGLNTRSFCTMVKLTGSSPQKSTENSPDGMSL
jgi:6-phosphofructo-2-kinase